MPTLIDPLLAHAQEMNKHLEDLIEHLRAMLGDRHKYTGLKDGVRPHPQAPWSAPLPPWVWESINQAPPFDAPPGSGTANPPPGGWPDNTPPPPPTTGGG